MTDRDKVFPTYPPSHKQYTVRDKYPMTHKNSVRVYRSSPETVSFQIRSENRIMTANLKLSQAKDIALHMIRESEALTLSDLDQLTEWMAT